MTFIFVFLTKSDSDHEVNKRARGHFMMLVQFGMHLIELNPRHILVLYQ